MSQDQNDQQTDRETDELATRSATLEVLLLRRGTQKWTGASRWRQIHSAPLNHSPEAPGVWVTTQELNASCGQRYNRRRETYRGFHANPA